jgi:hypothetical protein
VSTEDELRAALHALYYACTAANAAAVKKFQGIVIDFNVLDQAQSALSGEKVVSFCGGWPNVLTGPEAFVEPDPLVFEDGS